MALRFILNGRVMDDGETPNQETAEAPIQGVDGRTLIPYVQSVYHQDGSVVRISDRVDIGGRPLPPSGSYTQVLSTLKQAEATDHSQDPDIQNLIRARTMGDVTDVAQKAQIATAIASATNLVQTGSVPGTANYSAVVKPTSKT